jgi:hypothetical protein
METYEKEKEYSEKEMKEFSLGIDKEFSTGLRKYHKTQRKQGQFFDLFNFKPTQFGLVPFDPMVFPIADITYSGNGLDDETFPYPQLFIGKKYTFILGRNRIFYVNPLDWSQLYLLDTYDADNPSNAKAIPTGNSWEFVDFWDTWFFTNGVCTVFGSAVDTMMGGNLKAYVSDGVSVNCGTDHKGRVVFGGFDYKNFWDSTWQAFWLEWYDKNQDLGISPYEKREGQDVLMPISDQWIWWSSIGGGDAMMLFFPSLFTTTGPVTTSGYDAVKPYILDLMKRNEQGFAPMPFQGKVTAIKPLGDSIIVYSEEGVAAYRAVSSPAPTYSMKDLKLGGIASRGAVAGDDRNHVYIDNSGMAIKIPVNLDVQPLGYREFFYPMLGEEIMMSHAGNPQNVETFGEFYISNGTKNYGLTEEGLFEHGQIITSAHYFQGATIGFGSQLLNPADIVGRIGQDIIDFNLSGLKTIESVRIMGRETIWDPDNEDTTLQVALDYRYKIADDRSWSTSDYKKPNDEGVVTFPITALEFRLRIKVDDYERLDLDYAEFFIKHGDKRYKRSVPINQAFS